MTPSPASREGCRECDFSETSAGVLVGAPPCLQNGCEGAARAACPGEGAAAVSPPGTLGWVPFLTGLLMAFLLYEELRLISPLKADTAPPGPGQQPWPLSANQRQAGPAGPWAMEKRGCVAASCCRDRSSQVMVLAKSDLAGRPGSFGLCGRVLLQP